MANDIELGIRTLQDNLYGIYNNIQRNLDMQKLLPNPSTIQPIIDAQRKSYTTSLNILSAIFDEKNQLNPEAGFPQAGEKIIHVGDTFTLDWQNTIVPAINVFFMKGGQKIPVTIMKEETESRKAFVIDITHFSDEYVPCKIRIESTEINTIFDETVVFKVLKSN
jgi:hypothetical protein